MTFPFPRNRTPSLRLQFCDRSPHIRIIMTSCNSSWRFFLKFQTHWQKWTDNQTFHLILHESLNKSETPEGLLTSLTISSQSDAEIQDSIRMFQTDLLTKKPAGFTVCDLFFLNTNWCRIISGLKTAALSVLYYKTFMHRASLMRAFEHLLWQHFWVVEIEINLHISGGALRLIKFALWLYWWLDEGAQWSQLHSRIIPVAREREV